jgi:hypothetical protein
VKAATKRKRLFYFWLLASAEKFSLRSLSIFEGTSAWKQSGESTSYLDVAFCVRSARFDCAGIFASFVARQKKALAAAIAPIETKILLFLSLRNKRLQ